MQFRHLKTINPPTNQISKITAICWSPNNRRLAVADSNRLVHLFDENGEKRDRFSTKAADPKGPKTYVVRGMAFSPDSTKLAIAQSDNIVYIYKLGLEWGDKKSICNKFVQTSPITCLTWPQKRANELVFGTADGKVRVGDLRKRKAATLYSSDSFVVSLASAPNGQGIISGHLDGSIYRFYFEDVEGSGIGSTKIAHHSSVPYSLGWGESIVAAGSDNRVVFYYHKDGSVLQHFDYSNDPEEKEFSTCCFNPSGQCVIIGSFSRFRVFNFNLRRELWEEGAVQHIPHLYSLTAASWKPDGSRLIIGSLCGAVDMFDTCIRRYRHRGKFEFTYVSLSQVIVKRLSTGARIVLKSLFGWEITKVNVHQDQYLIAYTHLTLLIGDLSTCKLSEVPWSGSGNEKFYFDNPNVCMVFNAGELSLIEYGRNEILGVCRTEHMSPHLISVRINGSNQAPIITTTINENGEEVEVITHPPEIEPNKKIAYLIDRHTIKILDLVSQGQIATIHHDERIDWLELNHRATKLLFRDKKRVLHLFDIATQQRITLLNYCSYVQWVPDSDVAVAQNRGDLCVWYSIDAPDRVTIVPIKGDVEEIERSKGRTEVIVDEGINTVTYALDESLIEFGSAMEDHNYARAAELLEQLSMTSETEAMWQNLANVCLKEKYLRIAERCFAALGDVSKARYLHKTLALDEVTEDGHLADEPQRYLSNYKIRAKMAILNKEYKKAEAIYLEQGQVDDAMDMYEKMHRFEESIAVAVAKGHPDALKLKEQYYQWLLDTKQEEKAAEMDEKEGQYVKAINLYLQGGLPARAAQVVNNHGLSGAVKQLLEPIATSLLKAGMYDKAGEFFEKLGIYQRAIDAYKKGHAYRQAVELCRKEDPGQVVALEEQWGDWLVSQKQMDAAFNHYIEAGKYIKAVVAAIQSRQWPKAINILNQQDPSVAKEYYEQIARHYRDTKNYREAEILYIKAGEAKEAVEMYTRAGLWESAHAVAVAHMSPAEANALYVNRAAKLVDEGKFKEAEIMYLKVKEPDLAIAMYKTHRMYDDMIRLVTQYRNKHLKDTHLFLAAQLENEGHLKQAEHHFIQGGEWKSAVNMYRNAEAWEDAIRVAKNCGGIQDAELVASAWADTLGGEAGAKLLVRLGMYDKAIDYCTNNLLWNLAFEFASKLHKAKLPDVHLKRAMYWEDIGKFKNAEEEFIKAGKTTEAVEMYLHQRDWDNALRVAELEGQACVTHVLIAHGTHAFNMNEHERAESLFIKANRPEILVKMYMDNGFHEKATLLAREYAPNSLAHVKSHYASYLDREQLNPMEAAHLHEESGEYSLAIDSILKVVYQPSIHNSNSHLDELERCWEEAIKLAMNFVQERLPEVVAIVSQRLIEINRPEQAAELHLGIDQYKEAIDIYLQAKMWSKAQEVAATKAHHLMDYVRNYHKSYVRENKQPVELEKAGMVDDALSVYAQRGEWLQCLELAEKQQQPELLKKYSALYARQLVNQNEFEKALHTLRKYMNHGISTDPAMVSAYKQLASGILWSSPRASADTFKKLREVLYALRNAMTKGPAGANKQQVTAFEKLLMVAHYESLRDTMKEHDLKDLYAKLSVSLLRYCNEIPADRAFFDATKACKEVGWTSMAFIFGNKYLDISDAIEYHDNNVLENQDLEHTDIPYEFPFPENQSIDEEPREELRQWVLTASIDLRVEETLNMHNCDKCNHEIYEATLQCPNCKHQYEPCVVTGYPVKKATRVTCTNCSMPSNRDDWNKYLMKCKTCPWCNAMQLLHL